MSCAHARLALLALIRVGGACGPPPPVAAALASSLRAPSRGDPPLRGRGVRGLPPWMHRMTCLTPQRPVAPRGTAGCAAAVRSDRDDRDPRGGALQPSPLSLCTRDRVPAQLPRAHRPAESTHIARRRSARSAADPDVRAVANVRHDHAAGGRRGKERAASLRAQQRLAAGGRRLPRPGLVRASSGAHARRTSRSAPPTRMIKLNAA